MGNIGAYPMGGRVETPPVIPLSRFTSKRFDGTTDVAPAINAALLSLYQSGTPGLVGLPGSSLFGMLGQPIILQNATGLAGAGHFASKLKLANGVNADAIQNYVSADGVEANAQWVMLRDLCLDGNKANQTSGVGVGLNQNPAFVQASGDDQFDPHPRIYNVRIQNTKEEGFGAGGRSGAELVNLHVYYSEGDGIIPSTDSSLHGCVVGHPGGAGFLITAPSVRLVACKAFYAGHDLGTDQYGFEITNSCSLVACEAQDNVGSGFALINVSGVTMASCMADSNSKNSTGTYVGFDLYGAVDCRLSACTAQERRADGSNSRQRNALQLRSSSIRNSIEITHRIAPGSSATIDDAIRTASDSVAGNRVLINNEGGDHAGTYAASYTPNTYNGSEIRLTLTGNITINAVAAANCHIGSRMSFVFTQDGTGGRTVTWNAAYKLAGGSWSPTTTANKVNIISFVYNGTNWLETSRSLNL